MAVNSNLEAVVVWIQRDSSGNRSVYARRYSSTSYYKPSVGWGILKVLMRSIDELENPYVAINSSGDAVTV